MVLRGARVCKEVGRKGSVVVRGIACELDTDTADTGLNLQGRDVFLVCRSFFPLRGEVNLPDELKGAVPSGFIEEMKHLVEGEGASFGDGGFVLLFLRSFERPVDEEGASDEIGARHQSPVTAVVAIGTVVAHHEVVAGRNDEIFTLDVAGKIDGPGGEDTAPLIGWDGREVIVVGIVVGSGGLGRVGLPQRDTVAIDDAVTKVDPIAGKPDGPLDEDVMVTAGIGCGAEEDDRLIALKLTVRKKSSDRRRRRQGGALDEDMVAYQKGARHGRRGDGEVLKEEGHDEEGYGDGGAERGEILKPGGGSFYGLLHALRPPAGD